MIVVTGGAGFIGSNIVHELNRMGEQNILVVDDMAPRPNEVLPKFLNLRGAIIADYMDISEFRRLIQPGSKGLQGVRSILHQGACSNTLEDNGQYMMDNNYTFSKELLNFALERKVPFVYASTAAVYGESKEFTPEPKNEAPMNVYGYSKLAFDQHVRQRMPDFKSTVIGLRYFNVYGPRELHKGRMASVIHHFSKQLKDTGTIRMFEGSGGYEAGEQRRDFVFVKDLCHINFFFGGLLPESPKKPVTAVVNAGSGRARTFNDVAKALMEVHGAGKIEYIPFPGDLKNRYQNFTEGDLTALRAAGYVAPMTPLEEGVRKTFEEAPIS